jgi:amino acid transporter
MGDPQLFSLRKLFVGEPLATERIATERLTNAKALAVFSSDALSSVAYATEEILLALLLAGALGLSFSLPVAFAIAALFFIVTFSYRQTVFAYPSGGGSYIVAKDNLGLIPGLAAGAALLIDYVMTVAVSVSSGIAALTSAVPVLHNHRVLICLVAVLVLVLGNLRGVRESGSLFSLPTYLFVGGILLMDAVGIARYVLGGLSPTTPPPMPPEALAPLTLFLVLRAFAGGCTALTGVEAISNGIQAFFEPVSKNAARTLVTMAVLAVTMFLGISFLAHVLGVVPKIHETVVSQIARSVFGTGVFYYVIQAATMLVLVLAANTSFADFPRLSSILGRDGFLPRQMANRGDRLVFSNGIIILGVISALLIVFFGGQTHALIPLYAIGVFMSFTLSQSGMVVHWWRLRHEDNRWLAHAAVNGTGAVVTFLVFVVETVTKFALGAWVVAILIPGTVVVFLSIRKHYDAVARDLHMDLDVRVRPVKHVVVVPIAGIHRAVASTLAYARSLSDDIRAVHVSVSLEETERLKAKWEKWDVGVPLTILPSPYRSLTAPLLGYIDSLQKKEKARIVTVVIGEFLPKRWWQFLLHNQSALWLRTILHFRPNTVVVSVPYHLKH